MHLIWQIRKTDVAHQLFPDDAAVRWGATGSARDAAIDAHGVSGAIGESVCLRYASETVGVTHAETICARCSVEARV